MVFDDAPIEWSIPPNSPNPRVMPVQIYAFVDANHARNRVTHCWHTGVLIYLNRAPIMWYSKAHATVESSTIGSEFIVMRQATDMI
jgi:hypothetical protein